MPATPCEFCGHPVPVSSERCPHCYRPGLFPNVRAANLPEERATVEERYAKAVVGAEARGIGPAVQAFEAAAANSLAVIARPLHEVVSLAEEGRLLSTYYQKLDGAALLPTQDGWHERRGLADQRLYGDGKKHVHFAALSLEAVGLWSYGECSLVLRESMIGHRASVFEGNSTLFLEKTAYQLASGHRAPWLERQKLCVAKHAGDLAASSTLEDFQSVLLQQGQTTGDGGFVEVHVWGSLSAFSFERALVRRGRPLRTVTSEKALREKLAKSGVELEVV